MKKKNIIKKNNDFENILNKRIKVYNKYFSIFYISNNNSNKYGISVPVKIGKANVRNKVKRRIKNIIDTNEKLLPKCYHYVIIVKKEILELSYNDMEKEFIKLISNIKGDKHEEK